MKFRAVVAAPPAMEDDEGRPPRAGLVAYDDSDRDGSDSADGEGDVAAGGAKAAAPSGAKMF